MPLIILILSVLFCIALPLFSAADPAISEQSLFVSGQNGYNTYRIPAITRTRSGVLLAFCEGRKSSSSDTGNIDLLVRRSTDNGNTWSPQQIVWDNAGNTCGNPAPVVDLETGTIWLLSTWNLGTDSESTIINGTSTDTRRVYKMSSTDDGLTWSAATEITSTTKQPGWTWYATGPGAGIQLRRGTQAGRLIIACDHIRADNKAFGSHVIYSDDHGATWQIGAVAVTTATVRPNENLAVELVAPAPGGGSRVFFNARDHQGPSARATTFSNDGGVTYTPADFTDAPQFSTPTVQGGLARFRATDAGDSSNRILFSCPNAGSRTRMSIWSSTDEAQTWSQPRLVHEGASAYSDMTRLNDDRMALFYEKGSSSPYETITLARFNADWLDVTPPPAENPGAALWNFEEKPAGQIVSTTEDALLDVHPEGHALHMTATAAFQVIAGAPAYGNGRALNITGNGGTRILDSETANRFDFGANQSFTIEIVCRIPSGSTQVGALVAKDLAALSPSWWLRVENGKARFLVADNTAEPNISSAASINTGQWVHIAAVRDATHPASKQLRVYVNGTLSGSTTDTTTASLANGQAVWIGRYNAGTRLLTGDVDFVRITPQVLAPADFANASTQFPDPIGQAADLIWTGATNAAWDIATTANWKNQSGAAVTYHDGDQVTFDSSAGTTTVNLAGTVMPGDVIFDFDTPASYQLGGSMGIGGVAGLRKLGTGTLSMSNANSYTGATTISAGTLTVTGSLGHTAVTVADGATLAGNGNLGGSVTIQSGGIHSLMIGSTPATQITRTVSGALVLDAGNILTLTAAQLPANGTYILAIATGGISGSLGTINLPAGVPGSVVINGNNIELTIGSDYDIWAGPSGFDLTGGPNGDDDSDGLSNFQEYAFGLDPTNGHGISPVTVPDKPASTFTYTRRKPSLTGLDYTSQSSSTLEGWTDFPNPVFEVSDNADPVETITVTIPAALLAEPKIFIRVRAKE